MKRLSTSYGSTFLKVAFALLLPAILCAQDMEDRMHYLTACYAQALHIAPEWELTISFDTTRVKDGWFGATEMWLDYRSAIITYDTLKLRDRTANVHRRVTVHELMHILIADVGTFAQQVAVLYNVPDVRMIRWYSSQTQERLVERLARLFVNLLPGLCR